MNDVMCSGEHDTFFMLSPAMDTFSGEKKTTVENTDTPSINSI